MSISNQLIVSLLGRLPRSAVRPFAMRYIAGETLEEAGRVVRDLNTKGMMATVDVLGENISTKEEAILAVQACEKVLATVPERQLEANLSIKLTQFGIRVDEALCLENVKRLLQLARGAANFVRIDMEDSSLTSATLNLYEQLRREGFENVGVVIQAYLRRSEEDLRRLIRSRVNVRLVKGIYVEPGAIAFQDREEIRRNYLKLLRLLLDAGCYVGIATHDEVLVREAYRYIRELALPKNAYEFQMLYGVRPKLRNQIVADGHRMRIYVPFGQHWYAYSIRRFKENPQIVRYVLGALLFRK